MPPSNMKRQAGNRHPVHSHNGRARYDFRRELVTIDRYLKAEASPRKQRAAGEVLNMVGGWLTGASALALEKWNRNEFDVDDSEETDEESTSWEYVDFEEVATGEGQADPSILVRTDGNALFYPGRTHVVHGESESGKTWLVLHACEQLLKRRRHVVFVDFEDDAALAFDRLRGMKVSKNTIKRYFHYINPTEKPPANYVDLITGMSPDLVVLDGVTEAMNLAGLDQNSATDIATWQRRMLRPLTKSGPAVVAIDHEPHRVSGPARPIGSQHKRAGIQTSYSVKVLETGGIGQRMISAVVISKDRAGRVRHIKSEGRKRIAGYFIMDSEEETGDVTCKVEAPRDEEGKESQSAVPQHQQIRQAIDSLPTGTEFVISDIRERVPDIESDSIRKSLSRLVKEGNIKRVAQGKYQSL